MSDGSSRWNRYMSDIDTDTPDIERDNDDDDDCVPASAYNSTQTASTNDLFCRQETAPKYMRSALFPSVIIHKVIVLHSQGVGKAIQANIKFFGKKPAAKNEKNLY